MFGTDRAINSFELRIQPIADPVEQERCKAWGSVSYTHEIDFRNKTTDDCIVFYMFVKPDAFARYVTKIAHGSVDEMMLSVGSVAGFYSAWSPGGPTFNVKVLTTGDQQKIILPPDVELEPPRLATLAKPPCTFIGASNSASGRRTPRRSRKQPMSKMCLWSQRRRLQRRWNRARCRCWGQ